jgi:hypothetical protein
MALATSLRGWSGEWVPGVHAGSSGRGDRCFSSTPVLAGQGIRRLSLPCSTGPGNSQPSERWSGPIQNGPNGSTFDVRGGARTGHGPEGVTEVGAGVTVDVSVSTPPEPTLGSTQPPGAGPRGPRPPPGGGRPYFRPAWTESPAPSPARRAHQANPLGRLPGGVPGCPPVRIPSTPVAARSRPDGGAECTRERRSRGATRDGRGSGYGG